MFSTTFTLKIIKSLREKLNYYAQCEVQFCATFMKKPNCTNEHNLAVILQLWSLHRNRHLVMWWYFCFLVDVASLLELGLMGAWEFSSTWDTILLHNACSLGSVCPYLYLYLVINVLCFLPLFCNNNYTFNTSPCTCTLHGQTCLVQVLPCLDANKWWW